MEANNVETIAYKAIEGKKTVQKFDLEWWLSSIKKEAMRIYDNKFKHPADIEKIEADHRGKATDFP